ncbi:MAG: M20/M25/M40 family metallo-hydrolase [Caldilineaceae bacterium]
MTSQDEAIALLHGLVAIPSLSRQESEAAVWLVEQMSALGYSRAFVDGAGNAVGEMGATDAARTVILLGHIDTVPGDISVRVESGPDGPLLFGRGSVDAKGPLATFTAAVARVGGSWARAHDIRLVVVGAVEEEAATSKGARFIRARFNGSDEPIPDFCIIGEPSSWQRVTLGYKGRVLVEMEAAQPMAHTAGPDAGVATVAVDLWNWVSAYAAAFNAPHDKAFDQLLPSLRDLRTWTDEHLHDRVAAKLGIRLPVDFPIDDFLVGLVDWANQRTATDTPLPPFPAAAIGDGSAKKVEIVGPLTHLSLNIHAHEPAWRSDRNNALVRAFLAAIREISGERPGFVVKTGTSDMNVVGPAWGCPILAYGPGDSSLDHTPNEHIALDEYWSAVRVLEQALRNLA